MSRARGATLDGAAKRGQAPRWELVGGAAVVHIDDDPAAAARWGLRADGADDAGAAGDDEASFAAALRDADLFGPPAEGGR